MTLWKEIPNFPNYEVSEFGEIRRNNNRPRGRLLPGTLLKSCKDGNGYFIYHLTNEDGKHRNVYAHVAVALAFHGPKPSKGHYALHHDDDRTNNYRLNIRWGTQLENMADARRNGRLTTGIVNGNAMLTEELVRKIRNNYAVKKMTYRELGKHWGVSATTVFAIIKRRRWSHVS